MLRLRDDGETTVEEPDITAKLVDDIALEAAALALFEQHHRPQDAGDDTAPVDIADEHDRKIRGFGEAHIGDIAGAQIGLRRAAGPLHQHEIGPLAHSVEALKGAGQECRLQGLPGGGLGVAPDLALDHDLCAGLALRLQQHGVHMNRGCDTAGAGLQRLGAADLPAIRRHRRVVGHVLWLEGPHGKTTPMEGARQPRHDQRFADVGARPLKHDGCGMVHDQNSIPAWAFTPSRKGCFTMVISVTRSAAAISSSGALRPVTMTWRSGRRARSTATTSATGK